VGAGSAGGAAGAAGSSDAGRPGSGAARRPGSGDADSESEAITAVRDRGREPTRRANGVSGKAGSVDAPGVAGTTGIGAVSPRHQPASGLGAGQGRGLGSEDSGAACAGVRVAGSSGAPGALSADSVSLTVSLHTP
jgi:hypothetical protein